MMDYQFSPEQSPSVVIWFKVYAGFLCFIYAGMAAIGVGFLAAPSLIPFNDPDLPAAVAYIYGAIFVVIGGVFLAVCGLPFFLRPRPWVWVYDLVIIGLGMTSACFLPFSVILLIFWLKPETKRYFGKAD